MIIVVHGLNKCKSRRGHMVCKAEASRERALHTMIAARLCPALIHNRASHINQEIMENRNKRFKERGIKNLSNAELLEQLVGKSEFAEHVLCKCNDSLDILSKMTPEQMVKDYGKRSMGKAYAISAAFELGLRLMEENNPKDQCITTSEQAAKIMYPTFANLSNEECWILLLNHANKVIRKIKISQGGISETVVDIRLILKHSLLNEATGIILFHNHPSGTPFPSSLDIDITSRLQQSAKVMNIRLVDHIIIYGTNKYSSFSDEGRL